MRLKINFIKFKLLVVPFVLFVFLTGNVNSCPKKINWKKLKTETEVLNVLSSCLPLYTDQSVIVNFLRSHKITAISTSDELIYANVLTKSNSMWVEKQWMMEFVLDEHKKLKEIKVTVGLTGP